MKKIKWGIIGVGHIANKFAETLKSMASVELKAVSARNKEEVEAFGKVYGVSSKKCYISNEELVKDESIDAVYVAVPHVFHKEISILALKNGKAVLCEKPVTINGNEIKEVISVAEEKGLIVQAYQNRRFDNDFLTVQKVIEEGKLGEVLEVEMHYDYYRPEVPESITTFIPSLSYLYGHGCHTLDQVISYFGKPDNIYYDVRQLLGSGRMNDYFDLDLYYGKLKVSVKSSYFRIKERPSFVVYGKKGCFVKETKDCQEEYLKLFYMPENKDFGADTLEYYGVLTYIDEEGTVHEEKVKSVKGDYGRVYDDLYEAIINGKTKTITDEQTLLQMEILETGIKDLR